MGGILDLAALLQELLDGEAPVKLEVTIGETTIIVRGQLYTKPENPEDDVAN